MSKGNDSDDGPLGHQSERFPVEVAGPDALARMTSATGSVAENPCPDVTSPALEVLPWSGGARTPLPVTLPDLRSSAVVAVSGAGPRPLPRAGTVLDGILSIGGGGSGTLVAPFGRPVRIDASVFVSDPGSVRASLQQRQSGGWRTVASARVAGGGVRFRVPFSVPGAVRLIAGGMVLDSGRVDLRADVVLEAQRRGAVVTLRGVVRGPHGGVVTLQHYEGERWVPRARVPVRAGHFGLRVRDPDPSAWRAVRAAQGRFAAGSSVPAGA